MKKDNVAYIAKISILGVIATLMMLFEFALPFAPSFYELDLSEIVVLISGFALGPLAGVLTELVKILLNLLINGTATAFVGEAANFAIGVSFVLPAAIIYKKHKTLRGAIVGMIIGTLSLCVVGALINYYVLIPAFSHFMGMPMEAIIGMGNKVNKSIDSLWTLILFATVPFNLLKGVICSVVATVVYKKVSPIIQKPFK